ncbi:unnamed protein product [Kuraishia capsulata CBS 1993]|uniref:Peptidase S59 domain-containing protein n=1 Tax=Kuraishia capsulata CBS 1993 TaxID=1382522 RepID=W6MTK4_9ASCO|nr:uncharacterized protein KUCA_T00005781001 [Kuraishia capsulata CBS 1993]CDK29788.1 unnamed protein product [Kuraishia capsulata CBS 1993]
MFGSSTPASRPGLLGNSQSDGSQDQRSAKRTQGFGSPFGSVNNASTGFSSQPSVFGAKNDATKSSLFGTSGGSAGALFGSPMPAGNSAQNTAANSTSRGFGAKSTSFFGSQQQQQSQQNSNSNGLFGNSYNTFNNNQSPAFNRSFVSTIDGNGNPYGIDISATATSVTEMPKPLTPSSRLSDRKTATSSSLPIPARRKRSTSATQSSSSQPDHERSFLSGLVSTSTLGFRNAPAEDVSGIFSPEVKPDHPVIEKAKTDLKSSMRSFKPKSTSLAPNVGSSRLELRKLIVRHSNAPKSFSEIDPNEVLFKRRKTTDTKTPFKAFNPSRVPTKSFTNIPPVAKETSSESFSSGISTVSTASQTSLDEDTNPLVSRESDHGVYWSSPSISELSTYDLDELANVENFIVGRKGYGQVAFQYPVDLTSFAGNLQDVLGKTIKFDKGCLIVYDDSDAKPAQGNGLNVPATVTVQGSFPKDPTTGKYTNTPSSELLRGYINKLKSLLGMEFVNYDPLLGAFTFKVDHFSIWGAIDDEDTEMDPSIVQKFKEQQLRELATLERKEKATEFDPPNNTQTWGSFRAPDEVEEDEVIEDADQNDITSSSEDDDMDTPSRSPEDDRFADDESVIEVKAYEPDFEDIVLETLDTAPRFPISMNWDDQLKLAGGIDSALNIASQRDALSHMDLASLNDHIFGDFATKSSLKEKIYKDLRLESAIEFVQFSNNGTVLVADRSGNEPFVSIKSLDGAFSEKSIIACKDVFGFIKKSLLFTPRKNSFFKAKTAPLSFSQLRDVSEASSFEGRLWGLLSSLFDGFSVSENGLSSHLLDIKRRNLLVSWLKQHNTAEVERLLANSRSDPLDCVFLLVVSGDFVRAASYAMKSNNPHLAVLVSLLSSHDGSVSIKAARQLNEWRKTSTLKYIPEKIVKIFQLLKGINASSDEFTQLTESFSWTLSLNTYLLYGDAGLDFQDSLKAFAKSLFSSKLPTSDPFFHALRLYMSSLKGSVDSSTFSGFLCGINANASGLDARISWIIFELIVKTGKINVESWEEQYDSITLDFSQQLEACGMVNESVLLLNFLENDLLCKAHVTSAVHRQIDALGYFESEDIFEELVRKSHFPRVVLHEGKALKQIYTGDYWSAADSLLDANLLNVAHRLILAKVAASAVIADGAALGRLDRLLTRMQTSAADIDGWRRGGEIYKDYVTLLSTEEEKSKDLLLKLIGSLPLLEKLNFEVKAAITIMDRKIVALSFDTSFVDADKVTSMVLPESEDNYVKKRSPMKKLKSSLMA